MTHNSGWASKPWFTSGLAVVSVVVLLAAMGVVYWSAAACAVAGLGLRAAWEFRRPPQAGLPPPRGRAPQAGLPPPPPRGGYPGTQFDYENGLEAGRRDAQKCNTADDVAWFQRVVFDNLWELQPRYVAGYVDGFNVIP